MRPTSVGPPVRRLESREGIEDHARKPFMDWLPWFVEGHPQNPTEHGRRNSCYRRASTTTSKGMPYAQSKVHYLKNLTHEFTEPEPDPRFNGFRRAQPPNPRFYSKHKQRTSQEVKMPDPPVLKNDDTIVWEYWYVDMKIKLRSRPAWTGEGKMSYFLMRIYKNPRTLQGTCKY